MCYCLCNPKSSKMDQILPGGVSNFSRRDRIQKDKWASFSQVFWSETTQCYRGKHFVIYKAFLLPKIIRIALVTSTTTSQRPFRGVFYSYISLISVVVYLFLSETASWWVQTSLPCVTPVQICLTSYFKETQKFKTIIKTWKPISRSTVNEHWGNNIGIFLIGNLVWWMLLGCKIRCHITDANAERKIRIWLVQVQK